MSHIKPKRKELFGSSLLTLLPIFTAFRYDIEGFSG